MLYCIVESDFSSKMNPPEYACNIFLPVLRDFRMKVKQIKHTNSGPYISIYSGEIEQE